MNATKLRARWSCGRRREEWGKAHRRRAGRRTERAPFTTGRSGGRAGEGAARLALKKRGPP